MKASRSVESISDRLSTKLLIFVLSVIAGSVDVIGFLGLGALFIAHITGNLVVLAAGTAAGEPASVAHLLSVPVSSSCCLRRGFWRQCSTGSGLPP